MTFDAIKELLIKDRSIRRFHQDKPIHEEKLRALVELTRYCASGRNAQPLKYKIIHTAEDCATIFPTLAWAGYYTDWSGPSQGEQPTAYLIQCLDTSITKNPLCDEGLQLQAITLGAAAMGIGACIIKSFNVQVIREAFDIPEHLDIAYILALGYPSETAKIVNLDSDGSYKYYRDETDCQCVPKRNLESLILK